ncbi:MAG TPA: hypothetical protein ACHBX2_15750 [Arsenophonus nasoniae]
MQGLLYGTLIQDSKTIYKVKSHHQAGIKQGGRNYPHQCSD